MNLFKSFLRALLPDTALETCRQELQEPKHGPGTWVVTISGTATINISGSPRVRLLSDGNVITDSYVVDGTGYTSSSVIVTTNASTIIKVQVSHSYNGSRTVTLDYPRLISIEVAP